MAPIRFTRREFVTAALVSPAASLLQTAESKYITDVPLGDPSGSTARRLGRLIGRGLSARLSTDLSKIVSTDALATDTFFVRTAAPQRLPERIERDRWAIEIGGVAESPPRVTAASLETLTPHTGRYLLECSGNSDPSAYGLLSTADWEGVPLLDFVDGVASSSAESGSRILVS